MNTQPHDANTEKGAEPTTDIPEIDQLRIRVAELEAQLAPYLEADRLRELEQERAQRLEAIIDLLFPDYDARWCDRHPEDKPPIHPAKSWWWNGAYQVDEDNGIQERNGEIRVKVRSYVGGGETDDFECSFPVEWLQLDDPKPVIHEWIRAETVQLQQSKVANEIAAAKRTIAEQTEKLALLVQR